jgi:predicted GNAT family acetyltransferase
MEIKHENYGNKGAFIALENDVKAGEITYSVAGENKIIADHTEVNENFKGRGVGKIILLEGLIKYARENNIKIIPLCPFVKATFAKTPELGDVLA